MVVARAAAGPVGVRGAAGEREVVEAKDKAMPEAGLPPPGIPLEAIAPTTPPPSETRTQAANKRALHTVPRFG